MEHVIRFPCHNLDKPPLSSAAERESCRYHATESARVVRDTLGELRVIASQFVHENPSLDKISGQLMDMFFKELHAVIGSNRFPEHHPLRGFVGGSWHPRTVLEVINAMELMLEKHPYAVDEQTEPDKLRETVLHKWAIGEADVAAIPVSAMALVIQLLIKIREAQLTNAKAANLSLGRKEKKLAKRAARGTLGEAGTPNSTPRIKLEVLRGKVYNELLSATGSEEREKCLEAFEQRLNDAKEQLLLFQQHAINYFLDSAGSALQTLCQVEDFWRKTHLLSRCPFLHVQALFWHDHACPNRLRLVRNLVYRLIADVMYQRFLMPYETVKEVGEGPYSLSRLATELFKMYERVSSPLGRSPTCIRGQCPSGEAISSCCVAGHKVQLERIIPLDSEKPGQMSGSSPSAVEDTKGAVSLDAASVVAEVTTQGCMLVLFSLLLDPASSASERIRSVLATMCSVVKEAAKTDHDLPPEASSSTAARKPRSVPVNQILRAALCSPYCAEELTRFYAVFSAKSSPLLEETKNESAERQLSETLQSAYCCISQDRGRRSGAVEIILIGSLLAAFDVPSLMVPISGRMRMVRAGSSPLTPEINVIDDDCALVLAHFVPLIGQPLGMWDLPVFGKHSSLFAMQQRYRADSRSLDFSTLSLSDLRLRFLQGSSKPPFHNRQLRRSLQHAYLLEVQLLYQRVLCIHGMCEDVAREIVEYVPIQVGAQIDFNNLRLGDLTETE